jgi:hypothetical protein
MRPHSLFNILEDLLLKSTETRLMYACKEMWPQCVFTLNKNNIVRLSTLLSIFWRAVVWFRREVVQFLFSQNNLVPLRVVLVCLRNYLQRNPVASSWRGGRLLPMHIRQSGPLELRFGWWNFGYVINSVGLLREPVCFAIVGLRLSRGVTLSRTMEQFAVQGRI